MMFVDGGETALKKRIPDHLIDCQDKHQKDDTAIITSHAFINKKIYNPYNHIHISYKQECYVVDNV